MQTFAWDIWMTFRWEEELKKSNKIWPRSLTWRLPWVFDLTSRSKCEYYSEAERTEEAFRDFQRMDHESYFCLGPQYSRAERCRAYSRTTQTYWIRQYTTWWAYRHKVR